jgi:hypothetical protein
MSTTSMTPTPDALALSLHHAAVFSEHVGVGFGLAVVEWVLKTMHGPNSYIVFHDLDFILAGATAKHVKIAAPGSAKKRPDIIAEVRLSASKSIFYAIECKGTKAGASDSRRQISRGLEQVHGLTVNGNPVPSFVVGSRYTASGIFVQIVDPKAKPPESNDMRYATREEPLFKKLPHREGVDVDREEFAKRIAAASTSQVLLESGNSEIASSLSGEELAPLAGDRLNFSFEA